MKRVFLLTLIGGGILTAIFAAVVFTGRNAPPELDEREKLLVDRWARLRSCETELDLLTREAEANASLVSALSDQLRDCAALLKKNPSDEKAKKTLDSLSVEIPRVKERLKEIRERTDALGRLKSALVEYLMLASAALGLPPETTEGILDGSLREEDIMRALLEARSRREE